MKKFSHGYYFLFIAFLWSCALIFLPTISTGAFEVFNEKRIAGGIVLLIGSLGFIILLHKRRLNIQNKFSGYTWLLLFTILGISILLSNYPGRALLEVGWYICLLQFSLVAGYLFQNYPKRFEQVILLTIVLMASLYSIRVLGDFITGWLDSNWPNWPDHSRSTLILNGENVAQNGFLGFGNVRFLNHIQTWGLPLMVYGYLRFENSLDKGFKLLYLFLISFWWLLVFISSARGTLLASAIAVVCIFLLYRKKCLDWLKIYGLTVLIGFCMYFLFFKIGSGEGSEVRPLVRTDSSYRFDMWWAAWEAIKHNPFFGLGPMHMANLNGVNPISSPHNMYLMWAAEWGLPAFGIALFIGARSFWKWILHSIGKVSTRNIAITASLFAGAIHSGVSGLLLTPLSQLLFAAILGWAIGIYYSNLDERVFTERRNDLSYLKYGVLTILLCLNLFVFVRMGTDIPKLQENREKFQSLHRQDRLDLFPTSYATIYPRFWDQGFIGLESYEDPNKLKK